MKVLSNLTLSARGKSKWKSLFSTTLCNSMKVEEKCTCQTFNTDSRSKILSQATPSVRGGLIALTMRAFRKSRKLLSRRPLSSEKASLCQNS
jgi:hypothetical protein